MKSICIRIDDNLYNDLVKLSKYYDCNLSECLRKILKMFVCSLDSIIYEEVIEIENE